MAYGDYKDLKRRTAVDNVFRDKAFNFAKNPKYDGYQRGLASKKTKGSGVTLANKSIPQNEQLAEELHKPIIRKFNKRKVYSASKGNIWAADLADMQLISKFNKGLRFSIGVSIANAFQSILNKSNRKPNKIWVDKGSEFYNRSMISWLEKNDIELYSRHNEGK